MQLPQLIPYSENSLIARVIIPYIEIMSIDKISVTSLVNTRNSKNYKNFYIVKVFKQKNLSKLENYISICSLDIMKNNFSNFFKHKGLSEYQKAWFIIPRKIYNEISKFDFIEASVSI